MPPGILSLCLGERVVYAKCKGSSLKQYSSQHMTMNACPVDYKLILLIPNAHKKGLLTKTSMLTYIDLVLSWEAKGKKAKACLQSNTASHDLDIV